MAFSFFTPPTLEEVKAKIAGFAEVGKLYLDSWAVGDPGEQLYLAFAQTVRVTGDWVATITRGYSSLGTSTDPGDPDDFNPGNAALDPEPGMLSDLGLNNYYTRRIDETFASTPVTFTNTSNVPFVFSPEFLTLARNDDGTITYTNAPDPAIYTGSGGTFSLPPDGQPYILPVIATSPGSLYSASAGQISVLVSQPSGVTVENAGPAVGRDREAPELYRARCRTQAVSVSPNGAADKYRRAATTTIDGTPLLRADGNAVAITRVYVSPDSTTGKVDLYYATDIAGALSEDVKAANVNIVLLVASAGDCITLGPYDGPMVPDPLDPPGGAASTNVGITVTWAVTYRSRVNGKNVQGAAVHDAILEALADAQIAIPLGGFARVAGAGTVFPEYIRGAIQAAHPAITNTVLSAPSGNTAIVVGGNAQLQPHASSTETVEVNS